MQDSDYACFTEEARALVVKGINSENIIIVETLIEGSNLIWGSKSCTICIDFTSYIDFTSCINFTNYKKGKN